MSRLFSTPARRAGRAAIAVALLVLAACQESVSVPGTPVGPVPHTPSTPNFATTIDWSDGAVVGWNHVLRKLVVQNLTGPAPAIRMYALLSVAQHNALLAAERAGGASARGSDAGAVAGASAEILSYLFPAQAGRVASLVDELELARPGNGGGADFAVGESLGRTAAASVITRAMSDGFFAPFTGTVPVCAGCWLATPTPPAFATLGQAKTFVVSSGSQFQPPAPPAFGSPAFVADLAEVRAISDSRTPAQDSIAKVWALMGGTVTTLGYWNEAGANLVVRYGLGERRAAHVLALMNMAGYDALVSSHQAKYTHWLLRPSQADPLIVPAIGLPSFPAYPSNHATVSAAAAAVLGDVFPGERPVLDAAAFDAAISRIYGGIHYRFDANAGLALGRAIGEYVLGQANGGRSPYGVSK